MRADSPTPDYSKLLKKYCQELGEIQAETLQSARELLASDDKDKIAALKKELEAQS